MTGHRMIRLAMWQNCLEKRINLAQIIDKFIHTHVYILMCVCVYNYIHGCYLRIIYRLDFILSMNTNT